MNADLDETLNEMGPEYRALVARLRAAQGAGEDFRRKTGDGRRGFASKALGLRSYLTAASILVLLGLGVVFTGREDLRRETQDGGYGPREYRASVSEMIATQNPDGSWTSDFLTRRNAARLRSCGDPSARIAYKKAVRYLNSKGLLPLKG